MPADKLPEGTDTIVNGAGVDARDEDDVAAVEQATAAMGTRRTSATPVADAATTSAQAFAARVEGLKGQANDRARAFVDEAKTRATDGIDDLVRMIHDAAGEVDVKVGTQYGDYVRRAAGSVASVSEALKGKDADALFADARELIARSPGVAIGAAAAIGFVIARLARAGVAEASAAPEHVSA